MSVVPCTGVLRKLLEEAYQNIEYKSSAFWQIFLQRALQDDPNFIVVCEYSPDGSRRRVDIVIKRYNANHHNFTAMVYVEVKRRKGSIRDCEQQALDAALKAIDGDNLRAVYAMTTQGLFFRCWIVHHERRVLEPLHGENTVADRRQYIHVDSSESYELEEAIAHIRSEPPLGRNPILPSQVLEQYNPVDNLALEEDIEPDDTESDDTDSDNNQQYDTQQHDTQQYDTQQYDAQQYDAQQFDTKQHGKQYEQYGLMQVDSSHQAEASGQASQQPITHGAPNANDSTYNNEASEAAQSASHAETWKKVDIRIVHHFSKRDEYIFERENGKTKSTDKEDWKKTQHKGKHAWYYYYKGVYYYTREKLK
ncbi:hypothetical protein F4824DRAFT_453595 [Ustulina deusta]|nr:hypothetical protein F4824DRAFT_453595 [Ustulina deusta]